jgi:hypothetical protein
MTCLQKYILSKLVLGLLRDIWSSLTPMPHCDVLVSVSMLEELLIKYALSEIIFIIIITII